MAESQEEVSHVPSPTLADGGRAAVGQLELAMAACRVQRLWGRYEMRRGHVRVSEVERAKRRRRQTEVRTLYYFWMSDFSDHHGE